MHHFNLSNYVAGKDAPIHRGLTLPAVQAPCEHVQLTLRFSGEVSL
jgi:hypothetical protein